MNNRNYKHGHSSINGKRSPTYGSWFNMKQRCLNINNPAFNRYGGRGIMICERWMVFENFLADMGERPKGKTLDRIDNDGNYEPSNCRWTTSKIQARNSKISEEEKNKRIEKKKKIKEEKRNRLLFKLHGSLVPYDHTENGYKVLCKCKRAFILPKNRITKVFECSYCRKSQGHRSKFIKIKNDYKIEKALDVLEKNNLIKDRKLKIMLIRL